MPNAPVKRKRIKYVKRVKPARKMYKKGTRKPSLALGQPFPSKRNFRLLYQEPSQSLSNQAGVFNYRITQFRLNSCWDFDFTGDFYNKQPLYYDTIFNTTGPYKRYRVNAWKTTFTVINIDATRALNIYYDQGVQSNTTESDTPIEMKNRAGVIYKLLTPSGGPRSMTTFSSYRKITDFIPKEASSGADLASYFDTNPATQIFGSLMAETLDGSTAAFSFAVAIKHVFYITAYDRDSALNI